jgi:FkbM family methyltransferase
MKMVMNLTKNYGIKGFFVYINLKLGISEKIKLPKIPYPIYLRRKTSDIPTFNQIFTNKDYEIDLEFYPQVIIDAGANIGLSAIYFTNKYPESKVICIEPEKSNFDVLLRNIEKYKNISTLKNALSNQPKQIINVIDNGWGNWGFMTESEDTSKTKKIVDSVKTITIDEIINNNNIKVIDLLKIDIEGAEKELFESNYENWLPYVRCLIIELQDRMKAGSSKSFFKAISQYNFNYFQSGENLIFINQEI